MSKIVRRLSSGQRVTGKDFNDLLEYVMSERIAAVGPGIAITRGAAGVTINVDAALRKQRAAASMQTDVPTTTAGAWFFGEITTADVFRKTSPQSTNPLDATQHINVWQYGFKQVARNGMTDPYPYPNGWYEVIGGIAGTCYNLIEMGNPGYDVTTDTTTVPPTTLATYGKGLHGNGVDTEGSIASTAMEIQPIPAGTILFVYPVTVKKTTGNVTEYWVQYENGVDGACS